MHGGSRRRTLAGVQRFALRSFRDLSLTPKSSSLSLTHGSAGIVWMLTKEGCASRRRRLWEAVTRRRAMAVDRRPAARQLPGQFLGPSAQLFRRRTRTCCLLERDNGATLLCDNFSLGSRIGEPHFDRASRRRTWYDHRHSAGQSRPRASSMPCAGSPDRSAGRPGLVETEWLPWPRGKCLPAADVRNRPADEHPTEPGQQFRQLRRRKGRRTSLRCCGSACGPDRCRACAGLGRDPHRHLRDGRLSRSAERGHRDRGPPRPDLR